jgi:hypothetical protein
MLFLISPRSLISHEAHSISAVVCSIHKEAVDLEGEIYCPNCGVVFGYVTREEVTIDNNGQSNMGPPTNRQSLPDYVRLGSAPLKAPKGKYWLKFP